MKIPENSLIRAFCINNDIFLMFLRARETYFVFYYTHTQRRLQKLKDFKTWKDAHSYFSELFTELNHDGAEVVDIETRLAF